MLRLVAVSIVATLLVPFALSAPPTVRSYREFTLEQFQSIADDVLSVPEIAAALPDGSVLVFVVKDTSRRFQGTVSGGRAPLSPGGSGTGDAQLTAYPEFWGALVNACDRANTAKLGIRDGYIGIDGGAAAKAAANGIRTGQFDAQLAAVRPADGIAFPCMGENPTLRQEGGRSGWGQETYIVGDLGGRSYVIGPLGAIEGQLPSSHLVTAVHAALSAEEEWAAGAAISSGAQAIPDECKVTQEYRIAWFAQYFTALCIKERGLSYLEVGS